MRATMHAGAGALLLLVASLSMAGGGAVGAVFDAATCGSDAPLVITDATEAAELSGVRWVKGDLTFGRPIRYSDDDDWHFFSEDVPAEARDLRCVEGALRIWNSTSIDLQHLKNLVAVGGALWIYTRSIGSSCAR